ncbi:class I adenylate-forming enzyme family protein [Hoeflea alexandrii]|uniref:class I adenylate-forming enzyme family protein n=1 Tax=Hoeflea alexandrii TaxID=288436 RepID=UPI0022AF52A5|nr:long-chain-fatty-acid--CoA ligase [Hoeflea alexandrii]MCZ4291569.1 long-chain-fatty-acid--CoA ligase [Hoeflea alexandrii]
MDFVGDIVFNNPNIDPERTALKWDDGEYSYREFVNLVARTAAALKRDGISEGDRVAILMGNEPQYLVTYFAIMSIGGIYVPLNWRLNTSEHVNLMTNSGVKIIVTSSSFADTIALAQSKMPMLKKVVSIDHSGAGVTLFGDWLPQDAPPPARPAIQRDDIAAIVYTSGTTSLPKGACLTHRNVTVDIANVTAAYAGAVQTDKVLQVSPLYHQTIVHTLIHFSQGATVQLIKRFNPEKIARAISEQKITYIFLAPTMLYELLDLPGRDRFDFSSLRSVVYGAAPITGPRLKEAVGVFGQILVQAYGLTEATSHCAALGREEHLEAEGSIGKGIPGVELRVVDEAGKDCPPGVIGEILVRGPTVMKGYWKEDDKTAEAIIDGWLHSGDLARIDERGYMYIADRKKDLVISGGANIYPGDVEEVFAGHPDIAEVAAFGVPDVYWGEALTVAIVARPGKTINHEEMRDFAKQNLGGYQVPKRIEVLEELPRNPSGKVLKRVLREMFGTDAQVK